MCRSNDRIKEIEDVPSNYLCTSCGSCVSICPTNALEMKRDHKGIYIPVRNKSECNDCGLCIKVCPGHSVDFKDLNLKVFSRLPENPSVGNLLSCYLAYSTDLELRKGGQSGGVVSALLIYALERGIIDGAIVTRTDPSDPLAPETFVARTRKEIVKASKSKYCPVPTNAILRDELKEDERFAFVGIPCQIHGVRKEEGIRPSFKEKIVLHLGLFCERTLNFHFQEYLLSKIGVKREEVNKFVYRSKEWRGWPGDTLIELKDGKVKNIPRKLRINAKTFFTPSRCMLCFDKLNELADLSFGDAWLPEVLSSDRLGTSMIISRTTTGEKLLEQAAADGVIKFEVISEDDVIRSQSLEKKLLLEENFKVAKFFAGDTPDYGLESLFSKASWVGLGAALIDYMFSRVSLIAPLRSLLNSIPLTFCRAVLFFRGTVLSLAVRAKRIENPYVTLKNEVG